MVATTLGIPDERGSARPRKTSKEQLSAIIDAFLEDHAELLSSGKPWSISLTDVLAWIDDHGA